MKPLPNWRKIARKAWSSQLMILAGLLTGVEAVLSAFGTDFIPLPQWARMILLLSVIGAAFVLRLLAQKDMEEK